VPADDFTAPNEAYFAHADRVIDAAAQRGMLVLLAPAYLGLTCGSQGWCEQMLDQPVSAMLEYGRFLGDRYKAQRNILWVHGGDTNSQGHGADDHVNAIAQGIRERAPGRHLHTGHCSRNNSGIDCYDEPWLDVNNTYSNCSNSLDAVREDYARVPTQAFFYLEGGYENSNATLGCLIDQMAWAVLGGSSGHVFGNTPIWRFGDGGEDELSAPGSLAMQQLGRLFLSRAWFRLEPDVNEQVLIAGASDDAAAAYTSDGESILVYVPSSRNVTLDLSVLESNAAHAWSFDPTHGAVTDLGILIASPSVVFAVPGRRVLVIDTLYSELPAPGSVPYPFGVPVPALGPGGAALLVAVLGAAALRARRLRRATLRANA
jgi:hypothetical protein